MSVSVAVARGSCGEKAEEGELDTLLQQLSDARQVILHDSGVEVLLLGLIYLPETVDI